MTNQIVIQPSFGKDGKPFYISGPNENKNQSKKIVEKLFRNCGEGNFDYIVSSFDESKILRMKNDFGR